MHDQAAQSSLQFIWMNLAEIRHDCKPWILQSL